MSLVWSDEQQRCLEALGFTLYRTASASEAATQAAAAIDPLLRALLRAAGGDPVRIDAQAWMREMQVPPLPALRSDPAAKRALWPRLRAARRDRSRT